MRRLARWWRSGRRLASPDRSLLPKIFGAFVAVLLVASLLIFALETRLTRQTLQAQALVLSSEQGNALDTRIREDSSRIHLLMSAIAQQQLTENRIGDRPLPRRLIDVLGTLRRGDPQLEMASVFDLSTGERLQSLPGRHIIAEPGPLPPGGDGLASRGAQRVVPLEGGGYGLIYTLPVGRLDGRPLLLVTGYPLDHSRAARVAAVTGVDDVQLIVGDEIVATSSARDGGDAVLGDPSRQRVTQQLPDGRLARYVAIGTDHAWGEQAAIGLVLDDPLEVLDQRLVRTRALMVALLLAIAGSLAFALARVMTRPLSELTSTATAIAGGELDRSFPVDRRDEVGRLGDALERMRQALRAQLLVIRRQAEALQDAARRIVGSQDAERQRIAQDLHDGIQQQLVVLRMQVGAAKARLAATPDDVAEVTDELGRSIDDLLSQLRATGQQLFPAILGDRGLGGALFSLAGRSPVPLEVTLAPEPFPRIEEAVETNAYFLVSEAVTNALKHAGATVVSVDARVDGATLAVRVTDDGRGFAAGGDGHTGGLVHMRDRVHALGGTLRLQTAPAQGTVVEAVFPLPERERSAGGTLEVEQDGGDPPVEVELLGEPELAEDRVRVLLDGTVGDRQLPRDGGVPPA
jgi:signal transduction histidine kinase